jgi:hypothetical protein
MTSLLITFNQHCSVVVSSLLPCLPQDCLFIVTVTPHKIPYPPPRCLGVCWQPTALLPALICVCPGTLISRKGCSNLLSSRDKGLKQHKLYTKGHFLNIYICFFLKDIYTYTYMCAYIYIYVHTRQDDIYMIHDIYIHTWREREYIFSG